MWGAILLNRGRGGFFVIAETGYELRWVTTGKVDKYART